MVLVDTPVLGLKEMEDAVEIMLNRPDKRNAINVELLDALHETFEQLAQGEPKGVLLGGNGPMTCAGADREIVHGTTREGLTRRFHELHHAVHTYPGPTVMRCRGAVIGAGFQLAVACDFAILGTETICAKPEIKYGLVQPYPVERIAYLTNPQVSKEVNLSGAPISPERAYELGLVSDVVSPEEIEPTAKDVLEQLLEYDLEVYAQIKQSIQFDTHPTEYDRYR